MLHAIASHNSYHIGQAVLLRQPLGNGRPLPAPSRGSRSGCSSAFQFWVNDGAHSWWARDFTHASGMREGRNDLANPDKLRL